MRQARFYDWLPVPGDPRGGEVRLVTRPLPHLEGEGAPPAAPPKVEGWSHLSGRHVCVRNAGVAPVRDWPGGSVRAVPIGDAQPDEHGDFRFDPAAGGGRLDQIDPSDAAALEAAIQASHFGEVNTYYHLDRIAAYLSELLAELEAPPLPRVIAVVNAHHGIEIGDRPEGVRRNDRWVPFQGGHYRLPGRRPVALVRGREVPEWQPISPEGEIHLGPGRQLLREGALVRAAGQPYHANASHIGGTLYHEYGHHLTRHTADFRANALRPPDHQDNRKIALDEGTCDYWAAAMLETPHIWAWHRRHDTREVHPRSLVSPRTMADFDASERADPHANGTIWAAALWELRCHLAATEPDGARAADRLVLQMLLLIGREFGPPGERTVQTVRRARESFSAGLATLLRADEMLSNGQHAGIILRLFGRRGIFPGPAGGGPGGSRAGSPGRSLAAGAPSVTAGACC